MKGSGDGWFQGELEVLQYKGISGGCQGNAGVKDSVNEVDREGIRQEDCFRIV